MKNGSILATTLFALSINTANAASGRVQFAIGSDGFPGDQRNVVSATPFDPNSMSQDPYFGRANYSTRRVALELILNATRVRNNDSLVYRRSVQPGYRITRHWRFRASSRRVFVRYEIRF